MENVTPRATPDANAAIRRKLVELQEHQSWMHHVADAATGKLLTTQLRRPVTPLSRAQRLSRLGHQFDPSIFGTPTYRLTPKHPYQASPTGFLGFSWARSVSAYSDEPEGYAFWSVSEDLTSDKIGTMDALVFDPPQGRCLLTLQLGTFNVPGEVGRIRIEVEGGPAGEGGHPPIIATFKLAVHMDNFVVHTFDLVFVPVPAPIPTIWVGMILEPGSGLDFVQFRWLTLAPQRPSDIGL
jgi:hypothetical protein